MTLSDWERLSRSWSLLGQLDSLIRGVPAWGLFNRGRHFRCCKKFSSGIEFSIARALDPNVKDHDEQYYVK